MDMHVEFQRFGGLSPALMNRAPRYSAELTGADADHLRTLVPPDFEELDASGLQSRRPDEFRYEIVIDDDSGVQRVTLGDSSMPDVARPLVQWLSARAGI
jgi:hypothetical protein